MSDQDQTDQAKRDHNILVMRGCGRQEEVRTELKEGEKESTARTGIIRGKQEGTEDRAREC